MGETKDNKPSVKDRVAKKLSRAEGLFIVSNILMTMIFAFYSVASILKKWSDGILQYVIIGLLVAYVIAFIVLIFLFGADRKALKNNMQNYKFSIKIMKLTVNLINLLLGISIMFEAVMKDGGFDKIVAFIVAGIGIVFAALKFVIAIVVFVRKKKRMKAKMLEKAAKEERKKQRAENYKNQVNKIASKLNIKKTNDESDAAGDDKSLQ